MLSHIQGIRPWQIMMMMNTIQVLLCHVGLDRDALVQRFYNILGASTVQLMERLIDVVVTLCGPEARRLLCLPEPNNTQQHEDGREEPGVEQQHQDGPAALSGPAASPQGTVASSAVPYSSSADPVELPAAPSLGDREQPADEPGPEAAGPSEQGRSRGPSARGRGGNRLAGGPRRPRKRGATSTQRAPAPRKRRPPRRP
ncbi:hypothetical protein ASZ78_011872 [Callipepla squamata]|nr:hypothetical protein ASZ78_011872 [Callipepla squamata]